MDGRPWMLVLLVAACRFDPDAASHGPDGHSPDAAGRPVDGGAGVDAAEVPDGPPPDAAPVCGNGLLEPGEVCEVGDVVACGTSCGDVGTQACTDACTLGPCRVELAPIGAWEVAASAFGSYAPVDLPHTNWGCTSCSRHYSASVCDRPSAVSFRWASDNRARLFVGGTVAFDDDWIPGYCTDAPCCTKCCDTPDNCRSSLSPVHTLDSAALSLFTSGSNSLRWEVAQETGGSGFYVLMTLEY